MKTITHYPGVVLRALAGAGAMGGLVAVLAGAAVAAPVVSITERAPAGATRPSAPALPALAAVRRTPKAPKLAEEVRPAAFILQTAERRLGHTTAAPAVKKPAAVTA